MTTSSETWRLDGLEVTITHPDKLYWPDDGIIKKQLLNYYRSMAPTMLPYFHDRPVTLHLFPRGIEDFSFYRRDLPEDAPSWLRYVDYETESDPHLIQLPLIDNAAGLVWFANQGSIEFHLWASRATDLHQPDWAIFDLDPGDQASFSDVLQAALYLRDVLTAKGVKGYPKTSGGRGLHVYVPLAPGYDYDAVRAWVKGLGEELARAHPDLMATPHGGTHEGKYVTIDYIQNSIGHNTAAPYTVRANPAAPVSMPITWDEVEDGRVRPADFILLTAPRRVQQLGDLFAPVLNPGFHL